LSERRCTRDCRENNCGNGEPRVHVGEFLVSSCVKPFVALCDVAPFNYDFFVFGGPFNK
jgi:hypothetical protein